MPYNPPEKRKEWESKNKDKVHNYSMKYYYKNRDKKLEDMRKRYYKVKDTPEEKEKQKNWSKNYWENNKDIIMKKRANNPKRKEHEAIRRFGYIHFRNKIFQERKCCEFCGSIKNLEIHHKNYTKDIRDIQLLCRECHSKLKRKEKWR